MPLVDLTSKEFMLVCLAIEDSIDDLRDDPSKVIEDLAISNDYYLQYKDLQEKFPPPDDYITMLKDGQDE
jgi:hypothetical protein